MVHATSAELDIFPLNVLTVTPPPFVHVNNQLPALLKIALKSLHGFLIRAPTIMSLVICLLLTVTHLTLAKILFTSTMVQVYLFYILDVLIIIRLLKPFRYPIFFMFLQLKGIYFQFNNFVLTMMFSLNSTLLFLL